MIVGVPVGVVLSIICLTTKEQENKKKLLKWIKISFASILVLIAIFILYAIFFVILALSNYGFDGHLLFPLEP